MGNNGKSVLGGLAWSFAERISAQLVSTIVGIVLARILMPEDYGLISIVMVFISLCDVFVTSGFCSAVVQKKEADETDFNTAFYLSLGTSLVLYLVLFFTAPVIAKMYQMPLLSPVIRVLGIRLVITALNSIQQSYIRRSMSFRKLFVANIWGTVFSCGVGIAMAYGGFGVWALVAQYMANSVTGTVVLLFVCGWRPRVQFSAKKAREIFSFGWKVLCTQLVAVLESDIRSLIVGKVFGAADLAYFDQGKKYPSLLVTNVNSSLNRVMLPAFSKKQDKIDELRSMLRKSVRTGLFIIVPIMMGLFAVAESFVSVVLTDKWMQIVPFLRIFCVIYMTRPLEEMCHQAVIALGRSDISFKIMILINVTALSTVLLAVFVFHSVLLMAVLSLLNAFVSIVCFLIATNKLVGYRFKDQLADVLPTILNSFTMCVVVYAVHFIPLSQITVLVIQILVGIGVYCLLSHMCKMEAYFYFRSMIINRIFKNKNHAKE